MLKILLMYLQQLRRLFRRKAPAGKEPADNLQVGEILFYLRIDPVPHSLIQNRSTPSRKTGNLHDTRDLIDLLSVV